MEWLAGLGWYSPGVRERPETLWSRNLPEIRALYLEYNAVAHPQGETTTQFGARLKAALRENNNTHLIVDIRHNSGGNTLLYPPLLNAIIHFRESSPDHQIWVITSRRTFSAAQNFASTLDRYITDAIFVGEPTGSRPNFVGESPPGHSALQRTARVHLVVLPPERRRHR